MIYIISFAVVLILILLWFIGTNNSLIFRKNKVNQCRSGICVALKQRNDMIPNLVASLKNYVEHERETLSRVIELRSRAESADNEADQIKNGSEITKLLSGITVERYPELKANVQFVKLHEAIQDVEYELQAIRRTYNAAVVDYNNKIEMFPSSIVASMRGHRCEELIDIPESEKKNVNVAELFG